ncbi:MAG TPA: prepilin-type N-terminal cleavage/methylation domain-containing protein [Dissulfurispiraceae bacterium]|nr:prepilin-type N-terminal cleavage/methylation domain-containing protein [Dissulfurispiraceae bacterium]
MSPMYIKNDRGMTLIEVLIAVALLVVGILGTLTVFPLGWISTTRADRIGQAAEILHREMETVQINIQNECNPVAAGATTFPSVWSGGQAAAQPGDMQYTVTRTIQTLPNDFWLVSVQVTWTGNAAGTRDSFTVTRDPNYKQGC